ncbi:unnamed protein product, partial [Prorocentrum cordatum]
HVLAQGNGAVPQPSPDEMIAQLQSKCSACAGGGYSAVHTPVEKAEVQKKNAKKHDDNGPFKMKRVVRIHRDKVQCVALSGSQFATASWDCTVKIYSLQADKVVQSFGKPKCRWTSKDHAAAHDTKHHGGHGWGLSLFGSHKADHHHHGQEKKEEPSMHGLYSVAFSEILGQDLLACSSGRDEHGSIHAGGPEARRAGAADGRPHGGRELRRVPPPPAVHGQRLG